MCALKLGALEVELGIDSSGLSKGEDEVRKTSKAMETSFNKVGAAISAALSVEAARRVVMIADNMARLEGRVKNLTKATGDFDDVWNTLIDSANKTGISIDGAVSSFQRFAQTKEIVGATNAELLQFTDTINKLGIISGATSAEVSATAIQIGQAMTGNFETAGQEINSIQEQLPELARAVERSMGLAAGQFKNAFSDGKRSSKEFFDAVLEASKETNATFSALPRTVDMAAASLSNNFALAISEVNKQLKVTQTLSSIFDEIGQSLVGFTEGVKTKPLIDAQNELLKLNKQIEKINESTASRVALEKALTEATNPAARAAIQKSLNDYEGSQEEISKLESRRIELLKEIEELQKPKDEGGTTTTTTKQKFLFQQEGFGELSDQDAKALQEFNDTQKEKEKATQDSLDAIFMMNKTEKEKLAMLETESLSAIDDLYLQDQINFEQSEAAKIEIGKNFAKQRADLEEETANDVARAYDRLSKTIGDSLGSALAGTQSWADAMKTILADLASQLIQAGIVSAFGGTASSGNVFADMFTGAATSTGGGRAMGGPTSGSLTHPINERGTPEILNQAGKQYLLPTGQNGTITPLSQNQGGGTPNISMINMGTPQEVQGVSMTKDGIEIMIADSLKKYDQGLTAELGKPGTKKGKSIQSAFKIPVNVGRS